MCDGAASGLPIAPRLYSADRQADTAAARRFVGWRRATSVVRRSSSSLWTMLDVGPVSSLPLPVAAVSAVPGAARRAVRRLDSVQREHGKRRTGRGR